MRRLEARPYAHWYAHAARRRLALWRSRSPFSDRRSTSSTGILGRRRPKLHVKAHNTGGGSKVDFTALVSNVGTAPALGCVLTAELDDGVGLVYESAPFALAEGELEHAVRFGLERPRYGDLVPALNNVFTLYGRRLTVTVRSGRARAVDVVDEERYDPAVDAARVEAQREAWERGRPLARPS